MSSEFVRYASEIETIDPHIDELLAQIVDMAEKKARESPRTEDAGRAGRAAHRKSFGPDQVRRRYWRKCRRRMRRASTPSRTATPDRATLGSYRLQAQHAITQEAASPVARATCMTLTSEDVDSRRTL